DPQLQLLPHHTQVDALARVTSPCQRHARASRVRSAPHPRDQTMAGATRFDVRCRPALGTLTLLSGETDRYAHVAASVLRVEARGRDRLTLGAGQELDVIGQTPKAGRALHRTPLSRAAQTEVQ